MVKGVSYYGIRRNEIMIEPNYYAYQDQYQVVYIIIATDRNNGHIQADDYKITQQR